MIKAILFFVIGAGAAYLYMNPGDIHGMIEMGKDLTNSGAKTIVEMTSD